MVSRFLNKNRHVYIPEDAEKINERLNREHTAWHVRIKKYIIEFHGKLKSHVSSVSVVFI
jgi:predicted transcriptional regulator